MSAPAADETLDRVVQLLLEASRPSRIILFGSRARGEETPDSDLDLVVILPRVENHFREMVRLRRALAPVRMPIDVLVYSEDDVRARGGWLGTALHDALQHGKVIYAG
jgi:predicted nucleotidyltransferase